MKKIIIFCLFFINFSLYGYFDNVNYSVKSHSSGNITVANLINSDSVFYNPALLSLIKNYSIAVNLFHWYPDIINNSVYTYNISAAKRINNNGVGVGYSKFDSDNYNESLYTVGYSRLFGKFSAGLSLKYGTVGFIESTKYDPVFNKSISFFSSSLGVSYTFDKYRMGFSIYNLYSTKNGASFKDSLNRCFNIGAAYNLMKNIRIMGEFSYLENYFDYKFGGTFLILKKVIELNAGINKHSFNFGVSFNYFALSVDYAVQYDFNFIELSTTQMIGIRVNL